MSRHASTLIVFALDIESQGHFDDLSLLHCGIGKVNAAYRLGVRLAQWRQQYGVYPDLVLNLGSAGSHHFCRGSLINCTSFIQRDFDVTALGHPPYVTPFESMPSTLSNGIRIEQYVDGVCGTGDSFVTDGAKQEWNVIDMEAYALAKVCAFENVPFGCIKYITDGADGVAATSWEESLADTAK